SSSYRRVVTSRKRRPPVSNSALANGTTRHGTGDPKQDVLSRLPGAVESQGGNAWSARCPAHDDRRASLSVSIGEGGKVLLRCHAGCTAEAIVGAMGLSMADLFPRDDEAPTAKRVVATYGYTDEAGALLFQTLRYSPKDFRQRHPDGRGGWEWNLRG